MFSFLCTKNMDKSHSLKYYVKVIFSAYRILHKNDNSQDKKEYFFSFFLSDSLQWTNFIYVKRMVEKKPKRKRCVSVYSFRTKCCAKCQKCAPKDEHGSRRIMWNSSKRWICRHRYLRCRFDNTFIFDIEGKIYICMKPTVECLTLDASKSKWKKISQNHFDQLLFGHSGNALNCLVIYISTNCE